MFIILKTIFFIFFFIYKIFQVHISILIHAKVGFFNNGLKSSYNIIYIPTIFFLYFIIAN
jgi:hypothetical protein